MSSVIENAERLLAAAGDLAETKIELAKLKAASKVSVAMASIISLVMVIVFGAVALIVFSLGFAYLIGEALGNTSYGFFIIGAVYALAGLLVYVNRTNWIQKPLIDLFINKITDNDD